MIAQCLLYSIVVEEIVFNLKAWLYRMLYFRGLGHSNLVCKNACSSVGLVYKVAWMLLFLHLHNTVSRNTIFLIKNLIVLCFSFSSLISDISKDFLRRPISAGDLEGGGCCDAPLWVQGKSLVGRRLQSSRKLQGFSTLKSLTFD